MPGVGGSHQTGVHRHDEGQGEMGREDTQTLPQPGPFLKGEERGC